MTDEPKPVTDEELLAIEATARTLTDDRSPLAPIDIGPDEILHLVAEVRRLRALEENGDLLALIGAEAVRRLQRLSSDEWLERAADEIHEASFDDSEANGLGVRYHIDADEALAILRKHRDGKA